MELNINGKMDTAFIYGNERLGSDRFTGDEFYYLYDPRGSVAGITDSDGRLGEGAVSNKRPDVYGVRTGSDIIDQVEVPSKTDTISGLEDRMAIKQSNMGDRVGSADVRSIPDEYSDLPIPKDIDLPKSLQYSNPKKDENKE